MNEITYYIEIPAGITINDVKYPSEEDLNLIVSLYADEIREACFEDADVDPHY